MLGLLAHKRAWRDRRRAAGLPTDRPNVVFGAETHVVWDKFANYFDVEMRKIPMKPDRFVLSAADVEERIDENTIAVGAVLGTTHVGEADPIEEINDLLVRIKADKGWDIPLHVDGASGAFIAPFSEPDLRWDFRLEQVASINVSGHKYGLVYPGVGWLIFRDASKLPEDLVFSVNYLGGAQPTYTFNFSRGSAMVQAQMYNFMRLGRSGYTAIVETMLANARFLNESLEASGKFTILNPGLAEPVVTFSIKGDPGFDVYHLSARLREDGWIVPAYSLPPDAEDVHLMRVVVRLDLSRLMVEMLLRDLFAAWDALVEEQPVQRARPRSPTSGRRPRTPQPRARRAPAWRSDRGRPARPRRLARAEHARAGGLRHARGARAARRDRGRVELAAPPQGPGAAADRRAPGGRARQRDRACGSVGCSPIGSVCFALGSVPAYFDAFAPRRRGGTFFVGSLFFTSAAYLQLHETLRAPGGVLAESARPVGCGRSSAGEPRRIDFWAVLVQLVGTVLFNVSTFAATPRPVDPGGEAVRLGAGRRAGRSSSSSRAGSPTPR